MIKLTRKDLAMATSDGEGKDVDLLEREEDWRKRFVHSSAVSAVAVVVERDEASDRAG